MKVLEQLRYAKSHEWVQEVGPNAVRIGVSDYAQQELGDLVFVNLPQVGDEVSEGNNFADVESVKAVADIYSPVTGVVRAVNEELLDHPELINSDPYGSWFIEVEEVSSTAELMDAGQYAAFCELPEED